MKKPVRTLLLLSTLLLVTILKAQTFDAELLDNYFDSLAHHDQAMGAISIFQGDEEVYARAIGYADGERSQPARETSIYRVGSITKTFTTVIIHKLREEGLLSLEDKLSKYYPGAPNADKITLDQMLRHQSGIHNYTDAEDLMDWIGEDNSPEWFVNRISGSAPDFEPGEKVSYSNSNFLLLGYIAERVSGLSYPELLSKYITQPLGLASTYYGGKTNVEGGEVVSFVPTSEGWRVADPWSMTAAGAAGAISSSASDLNRFYRSVLRGELVDSATVSEMTAVRDGLGQGLFPMPFAGETGFGHNGGIEGFVTTAGHLPVSDITITYLGNGVRLPINDIALAALTIYTGHPFEMPDFTPVADLPVAEMKPYVGTYGAENFPMDIKVFIEEGKLYAQATGQGAFPLTPSAKHEFTFDSAGIRMIFNPGKANLEFRQGGGTYVLSRR